jgi:hypothetical protein
MDRFGTRPGDEMKRSAALWAASSLIKERRTDPGRRGANQVFPGTFCPELTLFSYYEFLLGVPSY